MIRKAQTKDINEINSLGNTLINIFDKIYNLDYYLNNDNYIVLVDVTDKLNGFMIMASTLDSYDLEYIIVKEDARRKGIAHNLINYFLDNYYKDDKDIILEVEVDNKDAIELYKSYGFEVINTRPKYYNGIDAYVMKRVRK